MLEVLQNNIDVWVHKYIKNPGVSCPIRALGCFNSILTYTNHSLSCYCILFKAIKIILIKDKPSVIHALVSSIFPLHADHMNHLEFVADCLKIYTHLSTFLIIADKLTKIPIMKKFNGNSFVNLQFCSWSNIMSKKRAIVYYLFLFV